MTPPTTPQTEAGRALLASPWRLLAGEPPMGQSILAIEVEARAQADAAASLARLDLAECEKARAEATRTALEGVAERVRGLHTEKPHGRDVWWNGHETFRAAVLALLDAER